MYQSTKTWGHERGLSCCFRQWRADSHCSMLHGYSLSIKLVFEATELDETNWVVDFGSFEMLKNSIAYRFDHTTLIADDDPHLEYFKQLDADKVIDLRIVPGVGCEAFAKLVYEMTVIWLHHQKLMPRVTLASVEVAEHGSNSAIYTGA